MSDTDYVVTRPALDLPPGFLPQHWDGLWIDRSTLASYPGVHSGDVAAAGMGEGVAVPTGRFESNDSGEVAEVFEVRP